jgi:GNAT superfamily N-acetyltransferase
MIASGATIAAEHYEVVCDGYTVSTAHARLDLDLVHRVLSQELYWAIGMPRGMLERAVANALPFGLYGPDGRQRGFARVTTDRATYAHLQDVFVLDGERGRGLGQILLDALFAHPDLQGLRRWTLVTRDAHSLYARYGFVPLDGSPSWMHRHDPEAYARAQHAEASGKQR